MKYSNIHGEPVDLLFSASKTIAQSDLLISGTTCQFYNLSGALSRGFLAHEVDRKSVLDRWYVIQADFQRLRQVIDNLVFYSND
jgi:hypothetical protein